VQKGKTRNKFTTVSLLQELVEVRLVAVVVLDLLLLLLVSMGVCWVQVGVVLLVLLVVLVRMRMLGAGGADGGDATDAQTGAAGRAVKLVDCRQALHAAGVVRFVIVGRVHVGQSAAQATPTGPVGGGVGGAAHLATAVDGGAMRILQRVGTQCGRGRQRLHLPHLLLADVIVVVLRARDE